MRCLKRFFEGLIFISIQLSEMHGTLRVKRWQSNFLANKTMRYVLELYVKNNSIQNNPCPKPNYKIVYWTLPPFRKSIHNITLVNYCHLCIDYESNKHRLKIFKKKKLKKRSTRHPSCNWELIYLTPSQVQGKLLYPLKQKQAQHVHAQLYSTFFSVP